MAKPVGKNASSIVLMDLLCVSPYYCRYLFEGLHSEVPDTSVASISFHLDRNYLDKHSVRRYSGLIDMIAPLRIRNKPLRQLLKAGEAFLNILGLSIQFLFKRPDILHVQWLPFAHVVPIDLWFLRIARAVGCRLVYTVHNVLPHDTGERFRPRYQYIYQFMDSLICHTQSAKEQLINDFGVSERKIWVIPHGPMFHDTRELSSAEARSRLGYHQDQTVVLFFGLIRPYKGVDLLLEAWSEVARRCPEALLVIAGQADAVVADQLIRLIRKSGIARSVETNFRFISDDELPCFHHAADVLVYPYRAVTQSGALLTGMAFGKPIVASAIGGLSETLKDNVTGVLVEAGNTQALTDALIRLIESPEERQRLGQAVFLELNTRYSWTTIARSTLECYRSVL